MSGPKVLETNAQPRFTRGRIATLVAASILAGVQLLAAPAAAQTICGERSKVISELALNFAESPNAVGLTSGGIMIELLVSPSGSWTILVTYPTHDTCLLATGDNWETIPVVAAGSAT